MGEVSRQMKAIKENLKKIKTALSGREITRFQVAARLWATVKRQIPLYNQAVNAMSGKTKTILGTNAKIEKINKFNLKIEAFANQYGAELEKPCWLW